MLIQRNFLKASPITRSVIQTTSTPPAGSALTTESQDPSVWKRAMPMLGLAGGTLLATLLPFGAQAQVQNRPPPNANTTRELTISLAPDYFSADYLFEREGPFTLGIGIHGDRKQSSVVVDNGRDRFDPADDGIQGGQVSMGPIVRLSGKKWNFTGSVEAYLPLASLVSAKYPDGTSGPWAWPVPIWFTFPGQTLLTLLGGSELRGSLGYKLSNDLELSGFIALQNRDEPFVAGARLQLQLP